MSSSLYFNGTQNCYLSIPNDASLQFGTGDFTIQWFQYQLSTTGLSFPRIFSQGSYNSYDIKIAVSLEGSNTSRTFYYWKPNANTITSIPGSTFLNKWIHIAISRSNSTTRFFINGVLVKKINDTKDFNYNTYGAGSIPLTIGNESSSSTAAIFYGYLYGFCWIKGQALYDSDATFTVPSTLPNDNSNAVLILTGDGFQGSLGGTVINTNVGIEPNNIPPSFIFSTVSNNNNTKMNSKIEESLNRKSFLVTNTSQSARILALKTATQNKVKNTYSGGSGIYVKNTIEKNTVNSAIARVRAGGYVVPKNAR